MTRPRRNWRWVVAALELLTAVSILALAAYLRFERLSTNPGWYSDEGTLADIASHLARGQVQYQALTQSTLLVARFPVVPIIVATLLPPNGSPLDTLRSVTATLGVLSTGLLYLAMRMSAGNGRAGFALLAAALFAVYPPAVFYARVGFSYNLLTPLMLTTFAGVWLYLERGSSAGAIVAGLAVGLGSVTDLMMISVLVPVAIVILLRNWRDLIWWTPLSLAPLALYALSIAARDPAVLATDLRFILGLMSAVPWWAQLSLIVLNLGTLLLTEVWWIPAIVGLTLLRPSRLRLLALLLLLGPLVLLGRTAGLAGLRLYSISPLFPFAAIGVASLLWTGIPWLISLSREPISDLVKRVPWFVETPLGQWAGVRFEVLGSAGLVFLLALSPIMISTLQLVSEVRDGFRRGDSWAYLPVAAAQQAIEFVNGRTADSDLVLASPAVAWALDSQSADFQQVLAYSGVATIDYPADLPKARFAHEASLDRAAFAIIDPIWRNWGAAHLSAVEELLREIESWPVLWQQGGIEVRENPGG